MTRAASPLRKVFPFLRWWPRINRASTRADLLAGFTGALLGLPQGVAFALLAGLPPEYGLYAAMIPPALSALFGSSWRMIAGPPNAVAILLFASLGSIATPGSPDYISLVLTVTLLTGIFERAMGLARLGGLVNFISHTVILGFSAGAAILIAVSQIKPFVGVPIPGNVSFFETIRYFFTHLPDINPWVTAVGVFTLLFGLAARKYFPRVPYMISATIAGSLFAVLLDHFLGNAVTGIKTVGALPSHLPPFSLPDLAPDTVRKVSPVALANTILALTLAISVGRSLGIRSGQRIDSNQEFIGQGISNIVGGFFSSFPSAGSFNRSGANYAALAQQVADGVLHEIEVQPAAQRAPAAGFAREQLGTGDVDHVDAAGDDQQVPLLVMLLVGAAECVLDVLDGAEEDRTVAAQDLELRALGKTGVGVEVDTPRE